MTPIVLADSADAPRSSAKPKTILIYSDTQNRDVHQQVADAMLIMEPDVIFHAGDCANYPPDNRKEWDEFVDITKKLRERAEFYPALGNHNVWAESDRGIEGCIYFEVFKKLKGKRWYSVDVDNIHFIILDTNLPFVFANHPQYQWLVEELKNSQGKYDFVIPIFHHTVFSSYSQESDKDALSSVLPPLFEKYGVKICFSGHHHMYERIFHNGIYYIVTGGGGGELNDRMFENEEFQKYVKAYHFCKLVNKENYLKVSVFDRDLNMIDFFMVYKKEKMTAPVASMEPELVAQ